MDDAVKDIATDAVKQQGLQRYIWFYLILVPIAATTASAVAIGIAALSGLSAHESAPQLYAIVIKLSAKLIFSIGAAYVITLVSVAVFGAIYGTRHRSIKAEIDSIWRHLAERADRDDAEYLQQRTAHSLKRLERQRTLIIAGLGFYGIGIFVASVYFLMARDFGAAMQLLDLIAGAGTSEQISDLLERWSAIDANRAIRDFGEISENIRSLTNEEP